MTKKIIKWNKPHLTFADLLALRYRSDVQLEPDDQLVIKCDYVGDCYLHIIAECEDGHMKEYKHHLAEKFIRELEDPDVQEFLKSGKSITEEVAKKTSIEIEKIQGIDQININR